MSGRIRSFKPEVLEDEVLAGLTDTAWRLLVGSYALADDYGNVRAGTKYLAAQVWQSTEPHVCAKVEDAVHELATKSRIQPYCSEWQRYYHIVGWDDPSSVVGQRQDNRGKPRVPTNVHDDESDNGWLREVRLRFAATRRDSPRLAASRDSISPLRAVQRLDQRSDHDHRSNTPPTPPQAGVQVGAIAHEERPERDGPADPDDAVVAQAFEGTVAQVTGVRFELGEKKARYLGSAVERFGPGLADVDLARAWVLAETSAYVRATAPPYRVGAFVRWLEKRVRQASRGTNGHARLPPAESPSGVHTTMSAPPSTREVEESARAFFAMQAKGTDDGT